MRDLFYIKECSSTNDEILRFLLYGKSDFISLYTFNQTGGRGQYGNSWAIIPEQNLAFSLAVNSLNFKISDSLFNYYTASIIRDFLASLTDSPVEIKWPNDIIVKGKKVVGILIEKKNAQSKNYYIIGIGINILQEQFSEISNAGSLFTQTGIRFDLNQLTQSLYSTLVKRLSNIPSDEEIMEQFNLHLFRKDKISVFETAQNRQNGIIRFADEKGELWIELEDGLQSFYHKEIKLLY
ncbi:biotin--[acetyl-CoA-carboxylase] ligase [Chryseobacterium sp. CT-SW4]|uniref:biotin--[acetyl-CoA-carboxylase] ligase n=1 Tax=Chryseobacterium sp. SW-1 TaxID=3157343 RepID=UPI003B024166